MKVKCIDGSDSRLAVGKIYTVRLESSKSYILADLPKGQNEFPRKLFEKFHE